MIGTEPENNAGGSGLWTGDTRYFKDPRRAVKHALMQVYPVIDRLTKTLRAAEKAAGIHREESKEGSKKR